MGKRWVQTAGGLAFSNALWWLLLPAKVDNLRSMVDQEGPGCEPPGWPGGKGDYLLEVTQLQAQSAKIPK